MSIRIIKQGIQDTVQDAGRYGFQHLGINPGGVADNVSASIANMLVGNEFEEAVIELHYPAATILFEKDMLIAISGADFTACINGQPVPLNTPVAVCGSCMLEFRKPVKGYCCYLAVKDGFQLQDWLGSRSTNILAGAVGYNGRKLLTDDVIPFRKELDLSALLKQKRFLPLGWKANVPGLFPNKPVIRICTGNEFNYLTEPSKNLLVNATFSVTNDLNRMGCRLLGIPLQTTNTNSLVSSAVTKGTIQLLPTGQVLILMADHQTTGGYPRIGHVASADMHLVAQLQPGENLSFSIIGITAAENILLQQHQYLLQLKIACNLRLQEYLSAHAVH